MSKISIQTIQNIQEFWIGKWFWKNLHSLLKAKDCFKFLFLVGRKHFEGLGKAVLGIAPRIRTLPGTLQLTRILLCKPLPALRQLVPKEEHANKELPRNDETQAKLSKKRNTFELWEASYRHINYQLILYRLPTVANQDIYLTNTYTLLMAPLCTPNPQVYPSSLLCQRIPIYNFRLINRTRKACL